MSDSSSNLGTVLCWFCGGILAAAVGRGRHRVVADGGSSYEPRRAENACIGSLIVASATSCVIDVFFSPLARCWVRPLFAAFAPFFSELEWYDPRQRTAEHARARRVPYVAVHCSNRLASRSVFSPSRLIFIALDLFLGGSEANLSANVDNTAPDVAQDEAAVSNTPPRR